jgi:hypothetical protein
MEYSDKLFQLMNGLKKLVGRPVNFQVQSLSRLATLLDDLVNTTPAPFKAFFKKAYNEVQSLKDGLESDDAGEKELKQLIEAVRNLWDNCKTTEYKKGKDLPQGPEDEDVKETLDTMHGMDMKKEGQEMLRKYAPFKKLIVPKLLGKRFKATRAPVIAITKNMLMREKLQKMKMSTGSFEGYPVIDNQVFVGVDMDWVNHEYKRLIQPAIAYIIEQLEAQTGKRYHMIGGAKKVGFVQWAWLVTDLDLKRLNAATMGGHFILKSWAFPFQSST